MRYLSILLIFGAVVSCHSQYYRISSPFADLNDRILSSDQFSDIITTNLWTSFSEVDSGPEISFVPQRAWEQGFLRCLSLYEVISKIKNCHYYPQIKAILRVNWGGVHHLQLNSTAFDYFTNRTNILNHQGSETIQNSTTSLVSTTTREPIVIVTTSAPISSTEPSRAHFALTNTQGLINRTIERLHRNGTN